MADLYFWRGEHKFYQLVMHTRPDSLPPQWNSKCVGSASLYSLMDQLHIAIGMIRVHTLWESKRSTGMLLVILLISSLSCSLVMTIWSDSKLIRKIHQIKAIFLTLTV